MNTLLLLDSVLSKRPPTKRVDPQTQPSRLSSLPPLRRRLTPTNQPSIEQPIFLRIFSTLWTLLLSFWRSVVGETRAERRTRRKRVRAKVVRSHDGEVDAGSSSDEGDDWVDPVTRAPDVDTPLQQPFSFRLRSASGPLSLAVESPTLHRFESHPPPPSILTNGSKPVRTLQLSPSVPTALAAKGGKLLPNPLGASLLVPSASSSRASTPPPPTLPITKQKTPFHLRKTLILDLDETLIHSTSRPLLQPGAGRQWKGQSHTVEVVLGGRSTVYHVYKRPFVDHFLKKAASWYTLVIFTASMPEYADPVIDWLDAGRGLFGKKLYRESCSLQPNGSYIKDLTLADDDLSRVCFMDNSPISYSWHKDNAVPIEGWTSDPNDQALLDLLPVLDSLRFTSDVRHVLGIRGF